MTAAPINSRLKQILSHGLHSVNSTKTTDIDSALNLKKNVAMNVCFRRFKNPLKVYNSNFGFVGFVGDLVEVRVFDFAMCTCAFHHKTNALVVLLVLLLVGQNPVLCCIHIFSRGNKNLLRKSRGRYLFSLIAIPKRRQPKVKMHPLHKDMGCCVFF